MYLPELKPKFSFHPTRPGKSLSSVIDHGRIVVCESDATPDVAHNFPGKGKFVHMFNAVFRQDEFRRDAVVSHVSRGLKKHKLKNQKDISGFVEKLQDPNDGMRFLIKDAVATGGLEVLTSSSGLAVAGLLMLLGEDKIQAAANAFKICLVGQGLVRGAYIARRVLIDEYAHFLRVPRGPIEHTSFWGFYGLICAFCFIPVAGMSGPLLSSAVRNAEHFKDNLSTFGNKHSH